jgi:hypothetical protein
MPVREKGRKSPGSQPARPSHVPRQPQTAAKVRGFSPIASGFTAETDWLLEEDGFELVVPLSKRTAVPSSPFGFPALSARATGSYDPQTVTYDAARGSALAQIRAAAFVVPGDA